MTPEEEKERLEHLEHEYPYVHCDDAVVSQLFGRPELEHLTPLESVFVEWYIVVRSPEVAFTSLINPCEFFDRDLIDSSTLITRKHVREAIQLIFRGTPFINLYTKDFVISLLHEEIEYYREKNRTKRFKDKNFLVEECNGKKSIHEEKMMESAALIKCMELLLQVEKRDQNDASPIFAEVQPSGSARGSRGLLAKVEALVSGREVGGIDVNPTRIGEASGTEVVT